VGDGVEEGALALVEPHLAHEPGRQPDQPRHHQQEEEAAEQQQDPVEGGEPGGEGAGVSDDEDLPADRKCEDQDGEHDRQDEGVSDRAAHGRLLPAEGTVESSAEEPVPTPEVRWRHAHSGAVPLGV
jgi:hypothetical protein